MFHVKINGRTHDTFALHATARMCIDELQADHPRARLTITSDEPRYRIRTWADGYGLWNAEVRDPRHDTLQRLTDKQIRNMRDAGKRAILKEIRDREESPTRPRNTISTTVHIKWAKSKQGHAKWGHYVGSPDTLHVAETPAP